MPGIFFQMFEGLEWRGLTKSTIILVFLLQTPLFSRSECQDTCRGSIYGTIDGGSALNQLPHSLSLSGFFTIVPPQVAAYGSRLILIECQHFLLS